MAPSRPTPPRQQQRLQHMGVAVRPGTAGPNRIQRPTAVPSGSAYALAGQESERFLARPSEDAAHVSRSGTQPTRLNGTHPYDLRCSGTEAVTYPDSAANSRSPDTTLQDSDEAYEQWVAEGRKACTTCKRKHPPPCRGRKRKAREPTVSRRGKGFPQDHCFACGESHPWPGRDGTLYHTKCPPFWVKPPEATNESPVAAAAPLDAVQTHAQHVAEKSPEPAQLAPAPTQMAPAPAQMAPLASTPSPAPQMVHLAQDNRSYVDRMSDTSEGFAACMAEYCRRDEALQSEEERLQLARSWYLPPDKQDEETRGTHGANEDYIWR